MKTINGQVYYTIGEVGKAIGRSTQTIKNWYSWAEKNSTKMPKYRTDLDAKGTHYFPASSIPKLEKFRDSISYGMMSDYNVCKWGRRGQVILERKEGQEDVQEGATT